MQQEAVFSTTLGGIRIAAGQDTSGNYTQPPVTDASNPTPGSTATDLLIMPGTGSVGAYVVIPSTGIVFRNNANDTTLWSLSNAGAIVITGSLSITGVLTVTPTQTVASGASAALKGLNVAPATITLTGTTQVTLAQGVTSLGTPTVTDASVVTIDTLATLYIAAAPAAAGSVTLTNTYALWVDAGATRLDGSLVVGSSATIGAGATVTTGDVTIIGGNLVFGAGSAKITPGVTSLLFRNNADNATNMTITDAGIVTIARSNLVVSAGSIKSASPSGGMGYATGAGLAATQSTNKSTTVTNGDPSTCGTITMNNAALNAGVVVTFAFTNASIAATDVLVLNHASGGTIGAYLLNASCGAGTANITVTNISAGNLSEAVIIRWALVKAVAV